MHWKDWCWSWNSNTLATWWEELTHWKRPWCWERLKAGGEGDDREWDGWMASPTQWTWVSKLRELVKNREAWHAAAHGVTKSWIWLSDWTEVNWKLKLVGYPMPIHQKEVFVMSWRKFDWAQCSAVSLFWSHRCYQRVGKETDSFSYVEWRSWTIHSPKTDIYIKEKQLTCWVIKRIFCSICLYISYYITSCKVDSVLVVLQQKSEDI